MKYGLELKIPGIPDEYCVLDPTPFSYGNTGRAQEIIEEYYSRVKGVQLYHNHIKDMYYIVQKK